MSRTLSIGQVASAAGVQISTIRFYERSGLLASPARTPGGHRHYSADETRQVLFIRRARELGFSIKQVRNVLSLASGGSDACNSAKQIAEEHLQSVRLQIECLSAQAKLLSDLIGRCDANEAAACPIIETFRSGGCSELDRRDPIARL